MENVHTKTWYFSATPGTKKESQKKKSHVFAAAIGSYTCEKGLRTLDLWQNVHIRTIVFLELR